MGSAAGVDRSVTAGRPDPLLGTGMNACAQCGDQPPRDWKFCKKCHRWHDLATALEFAGTLGIDEYRLRRALSFLSTRRRRFVAAGAFEQLVRRVEQLEAQSS